MSQPHKGPRESSRRGVVTGASGFIGHYLVHELEQAGWNVARVSLRDDARPTSTTAALEVKLAGPRAAGEGAVVFHLAGVASGDGEDDATLEAVNCELAVRTYRAACMSGARAFVYLSSSRVFGARTGRVDETSDVAPDDAYGRSKALAETRLSGIAQVPTPVVIVRAPPVYGAGCQGNLIRLLRLVDGPWPVPFGHANERRSYVSAVNLASALRWIGERQSGTEAVRIWHVADCELSTRELCERLALAAKRRARVLPIPRAALAPLLRATLGRRAAGTLLNPFQLEAKRLAANGWCPPQDSLAGFEEMVTWCHSQSPR